MTAHVHTGFDVPAEAIAAYEPLGGVDGEAVGCLVAAAMDRCGRCQEDLLQRMAELPVTVAKMVELAGTSVHELAGELPADMADPSATGQISSSEFRAAIAAGMVTAERGIVESVTALASQQRRRVAEDALEIVVGVLTVRGQLREGLA